MYPLSYQTVLRSACTTVAAGALLIACAHAPAEPAPAPAPGWLDGATGQRLSDATALAQLTAGPGLIFVAERHGHAGSHATQLEVLRHLYDAGRPLLIGIEWLPAPTQPALDRWLAGDDDVQALADAVGWAQVWGHEFAAYAPIFGWARTHGVRIIALNAPPGVARAVATHGRDGVPPDIAPLVPPLDTADDAHRAYFERLMRAASQAHGHAHGGLSDDQLDRYYLAQLVWDEAMSRALAHALTASEDADATAVVFAGSGHVDFGHGVPRRAVALTGRAALLVRPVAAADVGDLAPFPGPGARWPEARASLIRIVDE